MSSRTAARSQAVGEPLSPLTRSKRRCKRLGRVRHPESSRIGPPRARTVWGWALIAAVASRSTAGRAVTPSRCSSLISVPWTFASSTPSSAKVTAWAARPSTMIRRRSSLYTRTTVGAHDAFANDTRSGARDRPGGRSAGGLQLAGHRFEAVVVVRREPHGEDLVGVRCYRVATHLVAVEYTKRSKLEGVPAI
jgi:hypothetical protein